MLVEVLVAAAPRPGRTMSLARRTEAIEPFLAVEVAERAQELEQHGVDVVHLEFGEPDFAPPAVVRRPSSARSRTARCATRTAWASCRCARRSPSTTRDLRRDDLARPDARHARDLAGDAAALRRTCSIPATRSCSAIRTTRAIRTSSATPTGVPVYVDTTEEDGFQYRPEAIQSRLGPQHPGDRDQLAGQSDGSGAVGRADGGDRRAEPASDGPWIVSDEIYHGLTTGDGTARSSSSPTAPSC